MGEWMVCTVYMMLGKSWFLCSNRKYSYRFDLDFMPICKLAIGHTCNFLWVGGYWFDAWHCENVFYLVSR